MRREALRRPLSASNPYVVASRASQSRSREAKPQVRPRGFIFHLLPRVSRLSPTTFEWFIAVLAQSRAARYPQRRSTAIRVRAPLPRGTSAQSSIFLTRVVPTPPRGAERSVISSLYFIESIILLFIFFFSLYIQLVIGQIAFKHLINISFCFVAVAVVVIIIFPYI